MGDVKIKVEKYSFSKLNTFIQCPFRYYLQYVKGHYIDTPNINAFFGTLIHYCEEQIGIALKNHEEIPYEKIKDEFLNINRPKKNKYDSGGNLFGINILKKMFPKEFFQINDKGQSFDTKAKEYLNFGIYRLEEYMKKNPNLSVYGTEMHFEVAAGRFDLLCEVDGVLTLADFKTTSTIHRQLVTAQLNLYAIAAYQSGYIKTTDIALGVIHLSGLKSRFLPIPKLDDKFYLQFIK